MAHHMVVKVQEQLFQGAGTEQGGAMKRIVGADAGGHVGENPDAGRSLV